MKLEETLKDTRLFMQFSEALSLLTKSSRVLTESGADPELVKHIDSAIELISKQLDCAALHLETEAEAVKDIAHLSRKFGIPRAPS